MAKKEKPTTKVCKHCATEIPYDAKVCPNCRKKVKGGKLKWILLVLVILIAISAASGGNSSSSDAKPVEKNAETSVAEVTEEPVEITYNTYNCTELFDDLKNNALAAEKKHQDEYVEVKGYLGTIDSDGNYICLGAAEDDYDYLFESIFFDVTDDAQLDQILEMTSGQALTIRGKVTSVGEVLGYHVDITEILE